MLYLAKFWNVLLAQMTKLTLLSISTNTGKDVYLRTTLRFYKYIVLFFSEGMQYLARHLLF